MREMPNVFEHFRVQVSSAKLKKQINREQNQRNYSFLCKNSMRVCKTRPHIC